VTQGTEDQKARDWRLAENRKAMKPNRTISDALRDEELDRIIDSEGGRKRKSLVPRDQAARPLLSDGAYRRVPMRYDE
jgi:hypothetical protein